MIAICPNCNRQELVIVQRYDPDQKLHIATGQCRFCLYKLEKDSTMPGWKYLDRPIRRL